MNEEAKRAIEILERGKRANKTLLSEPFYPDKGLAAEYRDSYQLAITAIKQNEAVREAIHNSLAEADGSCSDYCLIKLPERILEILEGKHEN